MAGEAGIRARTAVEAGDPVAAMEIHMRDIVKLPAVGVAARFAIPAAREKLARFAAAQIADNEAIEALGVGIDRYSRTDLPTLLMQGERSPAHLRLRLADLAATLARVEIVTLDGQDHVANLTAPEKVATVIRDFAHRIFPPGSPPETHSSRPSRGQIARWRWPLGWRVLTGRTKHLRSAKVLAQTATPAWRRVRRGFAGRTAQRRGQPQRRRSANRSASKQSCTWLTGSGADDDRVKALGSGQVPTSRHHQTSRARQGDALTESCQDWHHQRFQWRRGSRRPGRPTADDPMINHHTSRNHQWVVRAPLAPWGVLWL